MLTLALLLGMLAVLLPGTPAFACSCAEPSLEDIAEREPDAAAAVVRRIDTDGGMHGTGAVLHELRGELPDEVALHLDDGGSCRPWLGIGQLAALTFVPDGDGWRTLECGMLDPASSLEAAYGPLTPDPQAAGPPGLVLAGRLPGADVAVLDQQLRVLATADLSAAYPGRLTACGDGVVVAGMTRDGVPMLTELALPDLTAGAEVRLDGLGAAGAAELRSVRCDDAGTVTAVLRVHDGADTGLHVWRDATSVDTEPLNLGPAEDAAALGDDEVLVLGSAHAHAAAQRSEGDEGAGGDEAERASWLDVVRPGEDDARRLLDLDGFRAYDLDLAPDGAHVLVRGFGDGQPSVFVIEVASGDVVASSDGPWVPVASPWVGPERILLRDEHARQLGAAYAVTRNHRVVDLELETLGELPPLAPGFAAAGGPDSGHIAVSHGAEVVVTDATGEVVRGSTDARTAPASQALVLTDLPAGPVPETTVLDATSAPPGSADADAADTAGRAGVPVAAIVALGVVVLVLVAGGVALGVAARRGGRRSGVQHAG